MNYTKKYKPFLLEERHFFNHSLKYPEKLKSTNLYSMPITLLLKLLPKIFDSCFKSETGDINTK